MGDPGTAAPIRLLSVTGATLIIARSAGVCGCCGSMRFNFVNRNGQTFCMICDQRARAANA